MRPDDLREEDDGAARPDHDVPDLEGLVAERDRVRAEVERLRREKREAEIELSILKGAVELAGIRAGRRPGQPDQWGEDDPRQGRQCRTWHPRGASARPGRSGAQHLPSSVERDEEAGQVFLVKLVFRFSSGIFFGFGRGCAGRVCFIGFGVCRT